MALITLTPYWRAASNADADTTYVLKVDITAPGDYQVLSTQAATLNPGGVTRARASATPVSAVGKDDTTIVLPTGSVDTIPPNTLISWDKEIILLGGVASGANDVYTNCRRGVGATIRVAHTTDSDVYGLHETYDAGEIEIGTRKTLRMRVQRGQNDDLSTHVEGIAIYPRARRDTHHTVIWGILQDENGVPQVGVSVALAATSTAYIGETGEHILPIPRTYTTDGDGYFEFDAVVSAAVIGSYALSLTIGPSPQGGQPITKALTYIPDRDYVNFEECTA